MDLKRLRENNIKDTKMKLKNPGKEMELSKSLQAYDELKRSIVALENKGVKAASLNSLKKEKKEYGQKISKLVNSIAPRTSKLVTPVIAAKLIRIAGGLRKLAAMSSSKIQILGAEKAFFKHLKEGTKAPKHGIIFFHKSVNESDNRGKAARKLANEIAKTARIDYYSKK